MSESKQKKVRRVYRALKRGWGKEAADGNQYFGSIRNQARLETAHILDIPIAEVKALLAATAGPQTTRPYPNDR